MAIMELLPQPHYDNLEKNEFGVPLKDPVGLSFYFLLPLISARNALRLMNTNYFTALRTGPTFLFISNKMSYAELTYVLEIVYHTHTIFSSIALI